MLLEAVLTGCSSSEPSPPSFTINPTQQWSGGILTIRSDLFQGQGSLPAVTAAGIAMTLSRVDDSTVMATLPMLSSQTATVEVVDGGTR